MTENTTIPSNVMEHVEPRQPAVGGGSQALEGIYRVNQRYIVLVAFQSKIQQLATTNPHCPWWGVSKPGTPTAARPASLKKQPPRDNEMLIG
jgi:hypothetical protein